MLDKIEKAANTKIMKPINHEGINVVPHSYTTVDMPFDSYDVKKVVNNHDNKRNKTQKHKHSSFENINKEFGNLYSFYLNRERVSQDLDVNDIDITPIKNDW
jgi:hypothetical protein